MRCLAYTMGDVFLIEHLTASPAAYFYARKKRLTRQAIDRVFRNLRMQAATPSRNLFRLVRAKYGKAHCSAICFSFKRVPGFLGHDSGASDRVHGFLMLVEKDSLVAPATPARRQTQEKVRMIVRRTWTLGCALALLLSGPVLAGEWYSGGTLHKRTLADWRAATVENRLATSADFAAAVLGGDRVRAMGSISRLRPYALEMKSCIDETARGGPGNVVVSEIAAACAVLLAW